MKTIPEPAEDGIDPSRQWANKRQRDELAKPMKAWQCDPDSGESVGAGQDLAFVIYDVYGEKRILAVYMQIREGPVVSYGVDPTKSTFGRFRAVKGDFTPAQAAISIKENCDHS